MDAELNRPCPFDHGFTEVAKKFDINLGEYRIMKQNSGDQLVLVKDHQTTAKSQALKILNSLAHRKEMKLPHLMELFDFSCRDDSHFCGSFYNYRSYYEFYKMNLTAFKEAAGNSQLGFSLSTMTKLLYDMVGVLAGLQQMNITHGDVRPELIFVSRFQGDAEVGFKLLDRVSERGTAVETQLNNVVSANSLYLSPSYYETLSTGKIKNLTSEAFKADVFSLGMVILELGLLISVQGVYDNMKNKFSNFTLDKLLEQFRKKYGRDSLLTEATYLMLQTDDSLRPDFLNLKERLPPYQQIHEFLKNQSSQQPVSRLNQQPSNIVMEKASFVENPLSMNRPASMHGFNNHRNDEQMMPRLPGQEPPMLNPNKVARIPLMRENSSHNVTELNDAQRKNQVDQKNYGMSHQRGQLTDSEISRNHKDLSSYLKTQLTDTQNPQPPALKKRRKLFEDAELASNPLPRDPADTPAREHTDEQNYHIPLKGYYGQSPHDMVYNNWEGGQKVNAQPNFSGRMGSQQLPKMMSDGNQGWSTPASVHSDGTFHIGKPEARLHQPDSVKSNQKDGPFSWQNTQQTGTSGNYGGALNFQSPQNNQVPTSGQPLPNNQARPQPQNGFPHNHNNLSNMIMKEKNDYWQNQQAQLPSNYERQPMNEFSNQGRRSGGRMGPLSMLRSPPQSVRKEESVHLPQPIMENFRKRNQEAPSPKEFMSPKTLPGSPPVTGQSGPNKFAPLVQKALPQNGSPMTSMHIPPRPRANQSQGKSHEFFSNDPMLRNMANQYY